MNPKYAGNFLQIVEAHLQYQQVVPILLPTGRVDTEVSYHNRAANYRIYCLIYGETQLPIRIPVSFFYNQNRQKPLHLKAQLKLIFSYKLCFISGLPGIFLQVNFNVLFMLNKIQFYFSGYSPSINSIIRCDLLMALSYRRIGSLVNCNRLQ